MQLLSYGISNNLYTRKLTLEKNLHIYCIYFFSFLSSIFLFWLLQNLKMIFCLKVFLLPVNLISYRIGIHNQKICYFKTFLLENSLSKVCRHRYFSVFFSILARFYLRIYIEKSSLNTDIYKRISFLKFVQ